MLPLAWHNAKSICSHSLIFIFAMVTKHKKTQKKLSSPTNPAYPYDHTLIILWRVSGKWKIFRSPEPIHHARFLPRNLCLSCRKEKGQKNASVWVEWHFFPLLPLSTSLCRAGASFFLFIFSMYFSFFQHPLPTLSILGECSRWLIKYFMLGLSAISKAWVLQLRQHKKPGQRIINSQVRSSQPTPQRGPRPLSLSLTSPPRTASTHQRLPPTTTH